MPRCGSRLGDNAAHLYTLPGIYRRVLSGPSYLRALGGTNPYPMRSHADRASHQGPRSRASRELMCRRDVMGTPRQKGCYSDSIKQITLVAHSRASTGPRFEQLISCFASARESFRCTGLIRSHRSSPYSCPYRPHGCCSQKLINAPDAGRSAVAPGAAPRMRRFSIDAETSDIRRDLALDMRPHGAVPGSPREAA